MSDLPPVHWWLAQYRWPRPFPLTTPEHECPPALPQGVTDWLVHQTASRGASIGAKAAHFMDYDRWNGTEQDVLAYIGGEADDVICPLDRQICPVHSAV